MPNELKNCKLLLWWQVTQPTIGISNLQEYQRLGELGEKSNKPKSECIALELGRTAKFAQIKFAVKVSKLEWTNVDL